MEVSREESPACMYVDRGGVMAVGSCTGVWLTDRGGFVVIFT